MSTSVFTSRVPAMALLSAVLFVSACDPTGSMKVGVSKGETTIGLEAKDRETRFSIKSEYNINTRKGSLTFGWDFYEGSMECDLNESHSEFIEGIDDNELVKYKFEFTDRECGLLTVIDAEGNTTEIDCCPGTDE